MSLYDRVRDCAQFDAGQYVPFMVDGLRVGRVRLDVVADLQPFDDVLTVSEGALGFKLPVGDYTSRTAAMAAVNSALREQGRISGWRDEPYAAGVSFSEPPLFELERAAVPLFGIRGYGVHVNGYVGHGQSMKMWIGRRSLSKPTGPGKLDQIVAGGQPAGMSLRQNVEKECHEEAGMPPHLAHRARPVSTVSYVTERPEGLRDDVLFNYDLELPDDFQPVNTDGEVAEFHLWSIDKIIDMLESSDAFKFNCALVIIDFLVRHNFLDPSDAEYPKMVSGLRA